MIAAAEHEHLPPPEIELATLNLLAGRAGWMYRRGLVRDALTALMPDIVALQEVAFEPADSAPGLQSSAEWLADQIGYAHIAVCDRHVRQLNREAVALISRLPLEDPACLHFEGQRRVAQAARLRIGSREIIVANTHLFWQPGESTERLHQVSRLIDWLGETAGGLPCIIAGDFNGEPHTGAIRRMLKEFDSAFARVHGREPEFTFPTPLKRSLIERLSDVLDLLHYIRPQAIKFDLRSTLDYIFVDPRLQVIDCRLAFDRAAPNDPRVFPSDHYGLWARVRI